MLSTEALAKVDELDTNARANTGPTDRLIIHKIVAENFKSYAGRQEIGPFHKGGESYQIVPGTELVVARTAWRNSRNVYSLNGASSNYTEITALLRSHGIDLDHKRFLILQGEVEAIAMMKPKGATEHEEGLLEYLEDIIGTNQYIESINKTAEELDQASAGHADKFLRVRAAERECAALVGEKEEAESYLRQENTQTEKRSELLQSTIWLSEKDLVKTKTRVEARKIELQRERDQNQAASEKAEELENSLREASAETAVPDHLIEFDISELTRGIEDSSVTAKRLDGEMESSRAELEKASGELDKISSSLKGVTAKHQKELDAKQKELAPLQEKLRVVQSELDVSKAALSLIDEKGQVGKIEQLKLTTRGGEVREEVANAERKMTTLEKQRKGMKRNLETIAEHIKRLEEENSNRTKQLQLLQSTTAEAMASMQQNESGSASYKALMKESKSGRIKGIHGRLGDLGAIDAQFDVAIATACSYLDHIVVDTTDVGQKCIEFLRRNNVGRANFIVLDKMRAAMREPPRDLPTGAQRLFDLVRLGNDRFVDAMYFALTDTLVASSLGEAQAWAYGKKRWRVVTVDGKLFEMSGTVSGGGQVRRGGMGTQFKGEQVSDEQVKLLQEKCREAQEELKQVTASIGREKTALADNEEQLIRTEAELSLLKGMLESLPVELEMIQKRLHELAQVAEHTISSDDEKERKKLARDIETAEGRISAIRTEMVPIEEAVSKIQQQILDAGGLKYKVQRSKVDGLKEQIENGERRQTELAKEKVALEKRLTALRSGQRDESAIGKIENELAELDSRVTEATMKAVSLTEEFSKLQNTLDNRSDKVQELKDSLDSVSKSVSKFRKVEYEHRCAIEADESKIIELERLIASCREETRHLRLHHIDHSQPLPVLSIYEEVELAEFAKNLAQIKQSIDTIKQRLEQSRPNLKILDEYRSKEAILHEQQSELSTIETHRDAVRHNYDELRRKRFDEFMDGFRTISAKLKEMYQLITMGGNAELELVDSLDPFSEGVLFSVMPPRKSWKNISNLSGGEKTLSSLALVFALHAYRPTPIYIMDEIDAALDFRNVSIVAHYIRERTGNAQFIVVSLRNNMFELADRLVGIYKTWQRTKCVAIDPRKFALPTAVAHEK
ncbi:Smc4 subunit of chromosomal cohesion complex [Paramicrosporidium saccamoebae]|uniref:Structural maintenance of chromosomes protein 4 n=1 Tax=Paramicrosporidium saccamoebae TaxID=1246581 RepID=A0A2H9TJU3_9FUNG|nr:Smc4 subunit of chromosomal cohesion complex [Paramicrosporidium saccamoebae]